MSLPKSYIEELPKKVRDMLLDIPINWYGHKIKFRELTTTQLREFVFLYMLVREKDEVDGERREKSEELKALNAGFQKKWYGLRELLESATTDAEKRRLRLEQARIMMIEDACRVIERHSTVGGLRNR